MKKKILLLPVLASLCLLGATSCQGESNEKLTLTYGTYASTHAQKITYGELLAKMDDQESFMIATYESDKTGCTCWTTLKYSMDSLVKEKHYQFYQIEFSEFKDKDTLGLTVIRDRPCFHFVNKGSVSDTYVYSTSKQNPIFKSKTALDNLIQEKCNLPNYYFLNAKATSDVELSILDKIKTKEEFVVGYYSESCGDCKYVLPNVLYKYTNAHDFNIPFYLVDLDVEGVAFKDGEQNKEDPQYQAFKNEVGLSKVGNATFGYETGYVPTFHYYNNGELKDACVYFNDGISKVNNEYKITQTYYTAKRQASLHYLDNVETPVLENMTLNSDQVVEYGEHIYFAHEAAAKYHTPILEAFLNTYLI